MAELASGSDMGPSSAPSASSRRSVAFVRVLCRGPGSAHDKWIVRTPDEQVDTAPPLHPRGGRNLHGSPCEQPFGEDAARPAKISGNPTRPAGRHDPQERPDYYG